jgi:hemerythrin superfamily protein
MSILARVVAAVTPLASEEQRQEARLRARDAATPGDWLTLVLQHHLWIEQAFADVAAARDRRARLAAHKALGILLTGHANAEESVLYPALARCEGKGRAQSAYREQGTAKLELGVLENLPPMSQAYLEKLEQIRDAVTHHVYEEEGTWFLQLKKELPQFDQLRLKERYQEEFDRYVGSEMPAESGQCYAREG